MKKSLASINGAAINVNPSEKENRVMASQLILEKVTAIDSNLKGLIATGSRDNEIYNLLIKLDLSTAIGNLARQISIMSKDIDEIKVCLQSQNGSSVSNVGPGNGTGNVGDKKSSSTNSSIVQMERSPLGKDNLKELILAEVKTGNGGFLIDKVLAEKKSFESFEAFDTFVKDVWRKIPEKEKIVSLRNIKIFISTFWKYLSTSGNEAKEEVTKDNPSGPVIDTKWFAGMLKVDEKQIIGLINQVVSNYTQDDFTDEEGNFIGMSNEDKGYIKTKAFGKDLSKNPAIDGFIGYIVKSVK